MESGTAAALINPVVIAPTYNNAATLAGVLDRVVALGLPLIVVNDGSTDGTDEILKSWADGRPGVQVPAHRRNRGKAAALRTGFAAAIRSGFTHALTIDTDGQHDPECIPALLEIACRSPEVYVLGVRDARHRDYPRRSRVGRRLSNLMIRLECGLKVADSQCGMRVYPLELVRAVRCRAGHFGYEAEMISRAGWAGCPVIQVPVNTRYLPLGQRVSHFHPWWDTLRGIAMHARLLLRAVMPIPHRRYRPGGKLLRSRVPLRDLLSWMNPLRAWRELREGSIDRTEFAAALAVGVFVANLPAYPLQTLISLYVARRLHMNPLAVLVGSQISTPPIGVVLIVAGIYIGHLILHGAPPPLPDFHSVRAIWQSLGRPLLIDWVVGGTLLGILMSGVAFVLANRLFRGAPDPLDEADPAIPAPAPNAGPAPPRTAALSTRRETT